MKASELHDMLAEQLKLVKNDPSQIKTATAMATLAVRITGLASLEIAYGKMHGTKRKVQLFEEDAAPATRDTKC